MGSTTILPLDKVLLLWYNIYTEEKENITMHDNIKTILIEEVTKIHELALTSEKFGHDYVQSLNGSATYFEIDGKYYKLELTCMDR